MLTFSQSIFAKKHTFMCLLEKNYNFNGDQNIIAKKRTFRWFAVSWVARKRKTEKVKMNLKKKKFLFTCKLFWKIKIIDMYEL